MTRARSRIDFSGRTDVLWSLAGAAVLALIAIGLFHYGVFGTSDGAPTCGGKEMSPGDRCLPSRGEAWTYGDAVRDQAAPGVYDLWWLGAVAAAGMAALAGRAVHRNNETRRGPRAVNIGGYVVLGVLACYLLAVHILPATPAAFAAVVILLLLARMAVVLINDVRDDEPSERAEVTSRYLAGYGFGIAFLALTAVLIGARAGHAYGGFAGAVLDFAVPVAPDSPRPEVTDLHVLISATIALFCLQDGWRGSEEDRLLNAGLMPRPLRILALGLVAVAFLVAVAGAAHVIALAALTGLLQIGLALFVLFLLAAFAGTASALIDH